MKSIYEEDYKQTIEKLKQARRKAGLTQVTASKKLKKPQSYISKIETSQRRIDIAELKELAKLYKIDPADLL